MDLNVLKEKLERRIGEAMDKLIASDEDLRAALELVKKLSMLYECIDHLDVEVASRYREYLESTLGIEKSDKRCSISVYRSEVSFYVPGIEVIISNRVTVYVNAYTLEEDSFRKLLELINEFTEHVARSAEALVKAAQEFVETAIQRRRRKIRAAEEKIKEIEQVKPPNANINPRAIVAKMMIDLGYKESTDTVISSTFSEALEYLGDILDRYFRRGREDVRKINIKISVASTPRT